MLTVGVYAVKQAYQRPQDHLYRAANTTVTGAFYTLEQCQRGAHLSGIARRDQAMPRWTHIQALHYRRRSLRDISRQVEMSVAQVHRVVAGRLWRRDRERKRSPTGVVVNSVRGTPRTWARVLALNEVYRSRCRGEDGLYKRMTARQGAYLKGIIKNRGPDHAAAVVAATTSYVRSLSDLDVAAAVRQVNLDSGYQPAAGTYHGATFWQRRLPFSTVCEDGIS